MCKPHDTFPGMAEKYALVQLVRENKGSMPDRMKHHLCLHRDHLQGLDLLLASPMHLHDALHAYALPFARDNLCKYVLDTYHAGMSEEAAMRDQPKFQYNAVMSLHFVA